MSLIDGSVSVLNDARYFLSRINSGDYNHPIALMSAATIGQHTRHFIEFFQCLLAQTDQKVINYCKRQRNLNIETDPQAAILAIDDIIADLQKLDLQAAVILETSLEGQAVASTIGRELFYNTEHGIHHLALIKIGLKIVVPQLSLPSHFGIAPSTIQYRIAQS